MTTDPASPAASPTVTAEGETFQSPPQRLRYVDVDTPAPGTCVAVARGVRWGRIPLPLDLNHINVWLIDTDAGCVVVDTGMAASIGKDAWAAIERQVFASAPLRGVFVTHIHPDHIGLAAWLQERHSVPVWMSRRTHEMARTVLGGEAASFPGEVEMFLRSHGVSDTAQILPMFRPDRFAKMASGLPQVERHIEDGELLRWGAGEWLAMETNGHAEGHLCLANRAMPALISGDQVLPTISPNISYGFRNRDPNPLGSYLASLQRLRELPVETLVLPSHGRPFRGLHQRIDDLSGHHHEQLATIVRACAEPRIAMELLPLMFRRELKGINLFLALGEALAHLEYLVHAGQLQRESQSGVIRYVSIAPQ